MGRDRGGTGGEVISGRGLCGWGGKAGVAAIGEEAGRRREAGSGGARVTSPGNRACRSESVCKAIHSRVKADHEALEEVARRLTGTSGALAPTR